MKKAFVAGLMALAAIVLITCFPLAWVASLAMPKETHELFKFSGSVWNGTIGGIPQIGPIELKTSPTGLLKRERALTFESTAPYLSFSGAAGLNREASFKAEGNIRGMGSIDRRFIGLEGAYTLNISDIVFAQDCQSATGLFTTDVLQRNRKLLEWTGPELSGPVKCEEGDVIFDISGEDNMQNIRALLRVNPTGTFQIEVDVKTLDRRADLVLPIFGFQKVGSDYRMLEAGRWY